MTSTAVPVDVLNHNGPALYRADMSNCLLLDGQKIMLSVSRKGIIHSPPYFGIDNKNAGF